MTGAVPETERKIKPNAMPKSSAVQGTFRAEGLTLARGARWLFRGLSLRVCGGEALLLRGANGSGKTSLLRVLAGFTVPDGGKLFWNDRPLAPLGSVGRDLLLYIGHANAIKDDLTALENLAEALVMDDVAAANRTPEALCSALDSVGLSARRDLPARKLSQGQKRRIGLARLLLVDKPLWLLDEPTNALDTDGVNLFTGIINSHLERGGLVLIASHLSIPLAGTVRELNLDETVELAA